MQANQQMVAHLTRVQSGFLQDKNIAQAQETLDSLHEILRDMRTVLHAPQPPPSKYVPMK
jgi:uncharacterized protein HemY